MALFPGLRTGALPKPPTVFHRLISPLFFVQIAVLLHVHGLPKALWHQITHPNPLRWISPWAWRDLILQYGFSPLLNGADQHHAKYKAPLLDYAQGRILEVGAGSGMTIKYYNPDKVEQLIAIEPFETLRPELTRAVAEAGLQAKTTILATGIDQPTALAKQGVTEASFDTIVLVQVLCSIPNPKPTIAYLASLLKPGGQLILFEHVGSKDRTTRLVQYLFRPYWLYTTQCCDLVRDSGDWLVEHGGWKSVELGALMEEDASSLLPHAAGRLIKA